MSDSLSRWSSNPTFQVRSWFNCSQSSFDLEVRKYPRTEEWMVTTTPTPSDSSEFCGVNCVQAGDLVQCPVSCGTHPLQLGLQSRTVRDM